MRINPDDAGALGAAIKAAAGRASAHIPPVYTVQGAVENAERLLERAGVPKAERAGAALFWIPAGPGKAYARKGRRIATLAVSAERIRAGWRVTALAKREEYADQKEVFRLTITPGQRDRITRAALAPFSILKD